MNSTPTLMTAEDLLALHIPNKRTELVSGNLRVYEPAGWQHGTVAARVLVAIANYLAADARQRGESAPRGRVLAAETGFTLRRNPDTVRAPDVAFVRTDRLPASLPTGFAELAPDIAVEVLSPSERTGEVLAKVADWLTAGTALVWIIDPTERTARVYRANGSSSMLGAGDSLTGEDVLPGFCMRLAEVVD